MLLSAQTEKSDTPIVNIIPYLISLIRIYFQDTAKLGIAARNQIIDFATAPLSDIMKNRPENRTEARYDMQFLNAQNLGVNEAEIEKIKSVFLAVLRDIKKDIDNGEQPGEVAAASMLQAIREEVKGCFRCSCRADRTDRSHGRGLH